MNKKIVPKRVALGMFLEECSKEKERGLEQGEEMGELTSYFRIQELWAFEQEGQSGRCGAIVQLEQSSPKFMSWEIPSRISCELDINCSVARTM